MIKTSALSLIELLITITIIGIIAAWAIPSYQQAILAAHRSDAKSALLRLQLKQQNWRSGHNSYGSLSDLKIANSTINNYYSIALTGSLDSENFMALATPNGAQKQDYCGTFAINQFGAVVKGSFSTQYASQDCWGE